MPLEAIHSKFSSTKLLITGSISNIGLMGKIATLLCLGAFFQMNAQPRASHSQSLPTLPGYYEGAIIKGNSLTLLTADFFEENDTLFVYNNIKEWTYYPDRRSVVTVDGTVLKFDSYYGEVTAVFDTVYSEMVGTITSASPTLEVHLKKVRRPPAPDLSIKNHIVDVGDISLNAQIIIPQGYAQPLPCAIYVQGRGCRTMSRSINKAKVLAEYGIATVVYDKRGAPGTNFDCNETTMELHASDLVHIIEHIVKLDFIDPERIGLIGGSYGGWVAPRAAAKCETDIAFIVSTVGPATSVQQQQLDNAVYYTRELLGGDTSIIRQIQEYTLLEYETDDDEATFQKMQMLLQQAEANGWKRILSKTDIPASPDDLKNLWVRRNIYDPADDLKSFRGAFLSILGEKDRVVPWRENSACFKQLFSKAGKTNYKIVVIPAAPHRLEHGNVLRDFGRVRQLRSYSSYFKFDRVVPGVINEVVDFLKEEGILY